MKILRLAQSYLAMLGIHSNQSLINVNFLTIEIIIFMAILSNWLYVLIDANDFQEITYSIFISSTIAMAGVCFTISGIKRRSIFAIIGIAHEIVEKSERTSFYKQLHPANVM